MYFASHDRHGADALEADRPRKRARAAGVFPAARALRSDVVRRAASRGGTLRCAEARRVAYRDVGVLRVSSTRLTWLVARRLQDSPAAVIAISFDRSEKPRLLERDVT
jgi:hypothetical protein